MQTNNIPMFTFRQNVNFNAEIIQIRFLVDLNLFQCGEDARLFVLRLSKHQKQNINNIL